MVSSSSEMSGSAQQSGGQPCFLFSRSGAVTISHKFGQISHVRFSVLRLEKTVGGLVFFFRGAERLLFHVKTDSSHASGLAFYGMAKR
jgi:hypothetical protein